MPDRSKDARLDQLTDSALKIIMEASPIGIIVFGGDERIIYANPLASKIFSKSATEISGLRCGDFIDCAKRHKDFQGCGFSNSCAACPLFQAIHASVSGGSNEVLKEGEAFLERDAGLSGIWVKFKVIGVVIEGSEFVLMTIDDITGYKQDEERLKNTLAELSVIHEHAPIAMMLVDKNRRICKVNGFASRFADRPVKEMIGLRAGEALRCLHHLDNSEGCGFGPVCADCRVRNAVFKTFETGVSQENIEAWLPFVRGDSIERRCLLTSTAHLNIHNSERVLVCAQDITDRKRAEDALRQSEAFIKSVMDNLPIGVAVNSVLPGPKFEYMNDNFAKFYRTTKEALCEPGAFWDAVYEDPIFREKIKKRVLEDYAGGDPERMYWENIPITRKGEETFFISAKNIPIPEKNLMISTVWDVTEQKRAEIVINESHQRVLTVLNNINAIVYVIDMDSYEVLFANQYVRDHFGATEGKQCWQTLQRGQTGPCDFCTNEKLIDAGGNPTGVYHWEFKNKQTGRWYDCHDSAIKWIDDRLVRMEIAIDITDRKKAEHELKDSEEKHRRLFETMSQGVIYQDATGVIISANPAAERILGLSWDQMCGKTSMDPLWKMIREDGSEVPGNQHPAMLALQTGRNVGPVTRGVFNPDKNTHIWLSITAVPLFQPDETTPFQVYATFEDITEKKQAKEEREKLQAQFIQAQKMESVGRLAGGVAHDINNKILVILGYAELVQETLRDSDPIYEFVEEIIGACKKSTDIVTQLLAFARKQTISPKVCDLNEIVEGMLKMLRRVIGEDIDLAWLPQTQLWPVRIDPSQIDQILANLCVNARDAIFGVGKITIETGKVVFDEEYCSHHAGFLPGKFVMLAVTDNGCGMNKETLDKIFEPFFTTKPTGKGTGLGLATVYGIVKQNYGFINVYSELGKGTTIKIYFLKHSGQVEEIVDEDAEQILTGHGETVLMVEDEKTIMKMSRIILEKLDYQVLTADTPGKALYLAKEHSGKIHLLITDVIMPDMNGRDLADQIHHLCPDIKILFMSGYTANVIVHHGVLDKGVHFIQKPFSKKDIAVKIRNILAQK